MIKVILLLANLETKVRKATKGKGNNKPNSQIVQREYKQLVEETEPYKRALPERPSFGKRVKAGVKNVGNVVRNVYANTFGNLSVYRQDYQTRSHYKKNPESKDPMADLIHGVAQTRGSLYKLGKQIRKAGYRPVFHKANHSLTEKEGAEQSFRQKDKLHKYTKLKNVPDRNDIIVAHSSGANRAIYMAGDDRIKKYGIKKIYAIAPTPTGIKPKTLGQKILMPFVSKENVKYDEGKRAAVDLSSRRPKVPVHVIAGRYDSLVPPKDAAYKHAEEHYVIEHPDSTHFGTSGVNPEINDLIIDLIKNQSQSKYKRYKRKGQVLEKQEGQNRRYYKDAA